jgi:hypothetical protein
MRSAWVILALLACLLSCKRKNKIPADVLSKEKMGAVLWDLMRADQFLTDFVISKDTAVNRDSASINFYRRILAIHGITREELQRSFLFYNAHPALLKQIMDSMAVVKPKLDVAPEPKIDTAKKDLPPTQQRTPKKKEQAQKRPKSGYLDSLINLNRSRRPVAQ